MKILYHAFKIRQARQWPGQKKTHPLGRSPMVGFYPRLCVFAVVVPPRSVQFRVEKLAASFGRALAGVEAEVSCPTDCKKGACHLANPFLLPHAPRGHFANKSFARAALSCPRPSSCANNGSGRAATAFCGTPRPAARTPPARSGDNQSALYTPCCPPPASASFAAPHP